ncbi:C9orf78-like protein, partial [Euroglyphus maynei]
HQGRSNRDHHHQQQQQPVQQYDIEPVVVIGDEPLKVRLPKPMDKDNRMPGKDKPLDNYMFEKFKKHIKKR